MLTKITGSEIIFETITVPSSAFQTLVEGHMRAYPDTKRLEREGLRLIAADFREPDLEDFIREVCAWGGHAGIAGRVMKHNTTSLIREQFSAAFEILKTSPQDLEDALQEINFIDGLGAPSFASKHLRFLRPEICPILDSVISGKLGYTYSLKGYRLLSEHCLLIAQAVEEQGVPNPMNRENHRWFAADVDMALFAHLRRL